MKDTKLLNLSKNILQLPSKLNIQLETWIRDLNNFTSPLGKIPLLYPIIFKAENNWKPKCYSCWQNREDFFQWGPLFWGQVSTRLFFPTSSHLVLVNSLQCIVWIVWSLKWKGPVFCCCCYLQPCILFTDGQCEPRSARAQILFYNFLHLDINLARHLLLQRW